MERNISLVPFVVPNISGKKWELNEISSKYIRFCSLLKDRNIDIEALRIIDYP